MMMMMNMSVLAFIAHHKAIACFASPRVACVVCEVIGNSLPSSILVACSGKGAQQEEVSPSCRGVYSAAITIVCSFKTHKPGSAAVNVSCALLGPQQCLMKRVLCSHRIHHFSHKNSRHLADNVHRDPPLTCLCFFLCRSCL